MRAATKSSPGLNNPLNLVPPTAGINANKVLMGMKPSECVAMENFFPFPDRLETRPGYVEHATVFTETPRALHTYSSSTGADTLFATCDDGVFDITSAGVVGAADIALTSGSCISTMLSTGAGHYMFLVNGVDTLKRFNGTSWSSIATLGAQDTSDLSYIETFRQRLYFIIKESLTICYLPVNSISGTATSYELGAIFRRGGYLVALGTWTVDSGVGPDDYLACITSEGEIAVFSGNDPSYASTWNLVGTYYLGRPLGRMPFYKYGGDLLVLCEDGLIPLSRKLQSAAIEKIPGVSENIRPLINSAARSYFSSEGWQVIYQADYPFLLVNIPSFPTRKQYVMNAQTGAWTTFTGWEAYAFARVGSELYFSTIDGVNRVTGISDNGGNITASFLQAYSRLGSGKTKAIKLMKPYFTAAGAVSFTLGLAQDFSTIEEFTRPVVGVNVSLSLWGAAIWGTAVWGTVTPEILQNWYTVPDDYSSWKGFYAEVSANTTPVAYFGADILTMDGGNF